MRLGKSGVRILFGIIVLLGVVFIVNAAVSAADAAPGRSGGEDGLEDWQQYDELTVGAAHGGTETSGLVVFDAAGERVYANRTYDRYFDVDPVAAGDVTVEYVGSKHVYGSPCASSASCTFNVIEQLNLSTGETTRVYARYTPGIHNSRWHDADRIDDHRYLVAGIDRHRVSIVNTTTGVIEWQWEAQSQFDLSSGGPYPNDAQTVGSDWTHINDVELLPDGRIMVSVRNQDQVVFVDRQRGVMSAGLWELTTATTC